MDIKISANLDANKALSQIGTFFENVPVLGNLIAKQKYRNTMHSALSENHAVLIKEGKATLDKDGKLIEYKDLNPIQRDYFLLEARIQKNEDAIMRYVIDNLKDKEEISDESVKSEYFKEEFIPYWQDGFRYMNKEDLQYLWAKILTQELETPNSISLRTMDFIKTLTKMDAEIFNKILPFTINSSVLPAYSVLHSMDFIYLTHTGLLYKDITRKIESMDIIAKKLAITVSKPISLKVFGLSSIGKELYSIADNVDNVDINLVEEIFDNDYGIDIGVKIGFHHFSYSSDQYERQPFRIYEKKVKKHDMIEKYRHLPKLSN